MITALTTALAALAMQSPTETPSDAEIEAALAAAYVPGLAVVRLRDCEAEPARLFGVRDTLTGESVDQRTVFEAASLTKPVFAYLVMQAVDARQIDLDASVADTIEEPRILFDDAYARLTPRRLLSHQSGLPNWSGDAMDWDRINRLSFIFEPGARMSYSGEGYQLAQRYFEARAGESFEAAFAEALGGAMPRSALARPMPETAVPAGGHNDEGRRDNGGRALNLAEDGNAAHSLVTTASDYAAFTARVCSGDGLSKDSWEAMLTPQIALQGDEWTGETLDFGEAELSWALGWGVHELDDRTTYFHWGDNGQFKAFVAFDRETGDGLVMLANGENALRLVEPLATPVFGDINAAIAFSD